MDYQLKDVLYKEKMESQGIVCEDCGRKIAESLHYHKAWDGEYVKSTPIKKCKCGGTPLYKNGNIQLCSKCLGAIWTERITLEEYNKIKDLEQLNNLINKHI